MRVRLGCLDGKTYESDYIDEKELQKYLDESKGDIGTGDLKGQFVVSTVDEFVEYMEQILAGGFRGMESTHITIEIDGRERKFLFDKIVWSEIERD